MLLPFGLRAGALHLINDGLRRGEPRQAATVCHIERDHVIEPAYVCFEFSIITTSCIATQGIDQHACDDAENGDHADEFEH